MISALQLELEGLPDCKAGQLLGYKLRHFLHKHLIGSKYSSQNLGRALRKFKTYLMHCGYPYADLRFEILKNVRKKRIGLKINVLLKQRQSYQFYGNVSYSSQELLNYLMFAGEPIWQLPLSLVTKDLLEFYRRNGFWQTRSKNSQQFSVLS